MKSPARPSASVMCSPFSVSACTIFCALSLTRCGDVVADRGDVVGEIEMHAGDGVADLFALGDEGVALVGEGLQQAADAHFVVVIGALQRGHFVGDERFKLSGTRKRALDAVAHRGDLAADRLADRDDRLARHLFRLGETHRDAGHRLRDQAQAPASARPCGRADRRT